MRRDLTVQVRGSTKRGFTLIELMVVVALVAVIVVLAGPSVRDMLELRRLKAYQSQLVTDMQFARSEAITKRGLVRVWFRSNASMTCYSIFLSPDKELRCDCLLGPNAACVDPKTTELRTVQTPASTGVKVLPPAGQIRAFAFEPTNGSLMQIPVDDVPTALENFATDSSLDEARNLRTVLNQAGRPTTCAPAGSTLKEVACP
jgi:type IV fimbrial biogenesis protein FimT